MDFWPEFIASNSGKEFVAGGIGGTAGIISGYPLDTLRILQQQNSRTGSAATILRNVVAKEGPTSLYRGMAAPLASVSFQVHFSQPFHKLHILHHYIIVSFMIISNYKCSYMNHNRC
ncbi:Mitochondrial arginine transporter bac2 [Stylosanthes scabra]|uniref:Mitochondrial arginine transporter bac2 n=1 Tax=Stylosanthes scabra TaxID=79078 RepID=A0ABU6Y2T3_9FABA|nr:Mitochondrial arginine transporter bac2 [Stylosanthes scabra]